MCTRYFLFNSQFNCIEFILNLYFIFIYIYIYLECKVETSSCSEQPFHLCIFCYIAHIFNFAKDDNKHRVIGRWEFVLRLSFASCVLVCDLCPFFFFFLLDIYYYFFFLLSLW